jgi:hypothetical protein
VLYTSSKQTKNYLSNSVCVNNISEVPDSPLYFVKNINQYVFKLDGFIFRGTVGSVFNKKYIHENNALPPRVYKCKNGNQCEFLLQGQLCCYWHDPYDVFTLFSLNKIKEHTYKLYINKCRNFMQSFWVYTNDWVKNNNIHMRHIGNGETLDVDIELLDSRGHSEFNREVEMRQSQTMHDILILLKVADKHKTKI